MNSVVYLILSAKVVKRVREEQYGEHRGNNRAYALIVVKRCGYDSKCKQYVADLKILGSIGE